MKVPPKVGISACLLGQQVRYDGGHKRADTLIESLSRVFELVPVCPEVEIGLGTPRETLRLIRRDDMLRMVTTLTNVDHTDTMNRWAARRLEELSAENVSGFVLKKDSPSCGIDGVKTFGEGPTLRNGRGLFAAALMRRFPALPVEDEERLAEPKLRDEFVRSVFDYHANVTARANVTDLPAGDLLSPRRPVIVRRVSGRQAVDRPDVVAVEEPLEIRLHDRPFAVIMRTPGADRHLAAGFLLAEGLIRGADELGAVEHCRHPEHAESHNIVNVFLLGEAARELPSKLAERRNVLANSSCGICGRVTIEALRTRAVPLRVSLTMTPDRALALPARLRERQPLFDETGALHASAVFDREGGCVAIAEDVGRHNAVDKVVGQLLLEERLPLTGHALVVSGRTSYEIVQKAWLASIELVCAVSAPSSLAIELADEAGITLIGFARGASFNIYSHPERIV